MSRTIDGPLDNYEPYDPIDFGPDDGEIDYSIYGDSEREQEEGRRYEDECCGEPRGFVGGVCDNCGGVVRPESK
jgi:hypothetical protein